MFSQRVTAGYFINTERWSRNDESGSPGKTILLHSLEPIKKFEGCFLVFLSFFLNLAIFRNTSAVQLILLWRGRNIGKEEGREEEERLCGRRASRREHSSSFRATQMAADRAEEADIQRQKAGAQRWLRK